MCALRTLLLLFPGTPFDELWRLNPDARVAFETLGSWSFVIMVAVGAACALTATGLWRGTRWGVPMAMIILSLNIAGDLVNVFARHDYRALVGLPIGGVMTFYLARSYARSENLLTGEKAPVSLKTEGQLASVVLPLVSSISQNGARTHGGPGL
jgi:hypothetical protein